MRSAATLLVLLAVCGGLAGEGAAGPGVADAPRPGIRWERDVRAGLARAAREGRPALFAVNALETESANQRLAGTTYRSEAWGEATRGYVAFVCNPQSHGQGEGACTRYPGHTCAGHISALRWFTGRFGEDLISPQHVILEPDGLVAYRKEYFEHVVGPGLLEGWLSRLTPNLAYSRAGVGREAKMKQLATADLDQVDALAEGWLDGKDGLAAAAIANVLDECYDASRRLAIIRGLRHAPHLQVPVLQVAAEDRIMYPAEEPAETLAWLRTLFGADRDAGVWGATRALVRLDDEAARDRVLRVWAGVDAKAKAPGIDDLPADERPFAFEALLLVGDVRARAPRPPATWTTGREAQIRRARRVSGRTTPADVELRAALADGHPGPLRRALVAATPEEVRANRDAVFEARDASPYGRVRIAAALALLRAREPAGSAATQRTILAALGDAIEGPDARRLAIAILGEDPGQSPAEWSRLLLAWIDGGAK